MIDTALNKGEEFLKQLVRPEIVQTNKFMDDHMVHFRLLIMEQIYNISVPVADVNHDSINDIWKELYSSFLADFNYGLVAKKAKTGKSLA